MSSINPAAPRRPLLISPHLDDAVLSCGEWLLDQPGTQVVTLFAGIPAPGTPLPDWDRRCGFLDPVQAMTSRREEDRAALAARAAVPRWLPFLDEQYGARPSLAEVVQAIVTEAQAGAADALLLPLGLFHHDHQLAAEAALAALDNLPDVRAIAYEDSPYRAVAGLLQARLAELWHTGWIATPLKGPARVPDGRKAAAVARYDSQLRGLGRAGLDDPFRAERLWTLQRGPVR